MELGVYTSSMEKHFKDQNHCVVGNKFWKRLSSDDDLESDYLKGFCTLYQALKEK